VIELTRLSEILQSKMNQNNWGYRQLSAKSRLSEIYISDNLMKDKGIFIPYYVSHQLYKAFPDEDWQKICEEELHARKAIH
jgi:hypothetical protein